MSQRIESLPVYPGIKIGETIRRVGVHIVDGGRHLTERVRGADLQREPTVPEVVVFVQTRLPLPTEINTTLFSILRNHESNPERRIEANSEARREPLYFGRYMAGSPPENFKPEGLPEHRVNMSSRQLPLEMK